MPRLHHLFWIFFLFLQACFGPDADGDGYYVNGFTKGDDCDDNDPSVHPDAIEVCNGIDDNCNASDYRLSLEGDTWDYDDLVDRFVDEGVTTRYGLDADRDGESAPGTHVDACTPPSADYVEYGVLWGLHDCDDANAAVNTRAEEICDGIDNDCNGNAPYGPDGVDDNATTEVCDGIDNDCDGEVDNTTVRYVYVHDLDGDGWGVTADIYDPNLSLDTCEQDPGGDWVGLVGDCDDADLNVNPSAEEICDGVDNDCDGGVDHNALDARTWYLDADRDGWGADAHSMLSCDQPTDYVSQGGDCDDANMSVSPGASEIVGDGIDNNCDGVSE